MASCRCADPLPRRSPSTSPIAQDTTPNPVIAVQAQTSVIPGKKLAVLPIGLGVFGGIALVTLAVVGLVTCERRKYRLQFRQRRRVAAAEGMREVRV